MCVKLSVIHGEDGEQSNFLGHRQHNDGDGTSGSSHGTSSPDIFREAATGLQATHHQHDEQVPPSAAAETDDDVVVMPQDLLAGIPINFLLTLNIIYWSDNSSVLVLL